MEIEKLGIENAALKYDNEPTIENADRLRDFIFGKREFERRAHFAVVAYKSLIYLRDFIVRLKTTYITFIAVIVSCFLVGIVITAAYLILWKKQLRLGIIGSVKHGENI